MERSTRSGMIILEFCILLFSFITLLAVLHRVSDNIYTKSQRYHFTKEKVYEKSP